MFTNLNDFNDFKIICKNENIEYHTYTISTEKTTTVVLKRLIWLPETKIRLGLNSIFCTEIPIHTKYPIYQVIFAPGTSMAQIKLTLNAGYRDTYMQDRDTSKITARKLPEGKKEKKSQFLVVQQESSSESRITKTMCSVLSQYFYVHLSDLLTFVPDLIQSVRSFECLT